ncbi:cytochrome c3 family protein [Desulfosporosinus nitroreducens]|uniref:NapC/NirT family cytochrome c n=1 Tax=Desulfosporosinus nitroreducens TaxID=2018668 RepID=A0ABT8QLS9_9FIRM|nr:NapC/NirT family cytochrome c [Desulfosporosinus nitroreducens]MCO1600740.1 NapC/NirT family cytochrome c [Desulfosporosinus nitroreducens]MDO0822298.1 NapC/NirT family cytochrome c [Desulfosporosinus nitroreducens]
MTNAEDAYKEQKLSRKTKKVVIISTLAVVLLGILALIGMHYTSQPNFCASCHQISPSVTSWAQGKHKDVTCLKCHADPGTIGYVKRKVGGLKEVYLHVTNQVPNKIEARLNTEACISCHTGSDFPKAKNLLLTSGDLAPKFPHAEIIKNKTSCLTCHLNVGHSQESTKQ